MTNNIKNLYEQLVDKETFIKTLSKEYNRTEGSIRVNWLSVGKIPENYKVRIHDLLINALTQQIKRQRNEYL